MTPERRTQMRHGMEIARTGWRQSWRELLWFFGALNDNGEPSAALFFAMAVGMAVVKHLWFSGEKEWGGWDVAMVGIVAAILFGSKMFMAWLNARQGGPPPSSMQTLPRPPMTNAPPANRAD